MITASPLAAELLSRRRGGNAHPIRRNPEYFGNHLRNLDVEPLPHFRAAMIEMHRSIRVDMDTGACLIEVGERK